MGIAGVIARAKKTVLRSRTRGRDSTQSGGLPGIVGELSDTLRSDAIPAPLRGAAARIADLLRAPEPSERVVVPLVPELPDLAHVPEGALRPHAIDAAMQEAHGGVCPFTGQRAEPEATNAVDASEAGDAASEQDLDAVASEVVADLVADASAAVRAPELPESEPDTGVQASASAPVEAGGPAREQSKARKASASVAPAKPAASKSVPPRKAASVPPKAATSSKTSGASKAPKTKNEKSREEVAAKPSPAKTSGRSSKGPTGKPSGAKKKK